MWSRLGAWLAKDNWQRRHFAATPFGIAFTTLAVTHCQGFRPPIDHFGVMANFASISAVIYGLLAVIAELVGGEIVFYTMMMAGKAWRKIKEENDERAVQRVNSNPALVARILENAGVTIQQDHSFSQTEPQVTTANSGT